MGDASFPDGIHTLLARALIYLCSLCFLTHSLLSLFRSVPCSRPCIWGRRSTGVDHNATVKVIILHRRLMCPSPSFATLVTAFQGEGSTTRLRLAQFPSLESYGWQVGQVARLQRQTPPTKGGKDELPKGPYFHEPQRLWKTHELKVFSSLFSRTATGRRGTGRAP